MSEELGWELYDIFASGIYAFPVYEHNAARRIVRYLLMRGVLDEDIANAIEGHTVDLHTWLSRAGKHMVGEWVIAWLNDRREHYKYNRHRRAQGMEETDIWERGEEEELELERQRRRRFQRRKRTKSSGQSDDEQDVGVELDESGGEDWSVESSSYRGSESSLSSISSLGSQISFASRKFKKAALNIPRRDQSGSPCRKISSEFVCNTEGSRRSHTPLTRDITDSAEPSLANEVSINCPSSLESPIKIRGRSLSLTTETNVQRSGSFTCCELFRKYNSLSAYDVRVRTLLSQFYCESRDVTRGKCFGNSTSPLETGEPRCIINRPNSLRLNNNLTDSLLIMNKCKENSLSDSGRNNTKIPQSSTGSGVIADAIGSSFLGIRFIGTVDKLSPDSGRASELLDVLNEESAPERSEELMCPTEGPVYYPAVKPCRCTLPHYISVNAMTNLRSKYSPNKCPVCNLGLIEKWKLFAKKKRKGGHALFCPAWKIPWTVL